MNRGNKAKKGRIIKRSSLGTAQFSKDVQTMNKGAALTHVAQWLEHRPLHQRVLSLIPGQGHVPGLQV